MDVKWRSHVVYFFHSACDKAFCYIGHTTRHLFVRLKEHYYKNSPIGKHILNCKKCIDSFDKCFTIIDTDFCDYRLKIKEAIAIKKFNPNLNKSIKCSFNSLDTNLI